MALELRLVKNFGSLRRNHISSVELSADKRLLAVAFVKKVYVYDTLSCKQKWSIILRTKEAIFSPHCTQLAVADFEKNCVKIFASETGTLLRALSGHTEQICGVAWSSTGIIASASSDQTVRLWNPDDGTCLRTLSAHSNYLRGVSFSPDGTQLASCQDNTVRIWDVTSGTCLHTLTGHTKMVRRVAFSPGGTKLASTSYDGTVRIWDTSSDFKRIQILAGAGGGYFPSIAWTPDSRILASANANSLQLWDEDGKSILQAEIKASALDFSCFSHEIITGSMDGKVKRWKSPIPWFLFDVKNGIPFGRLHPSPKSPHNVFSTLDRVSTIINRMDLPIAFQESISRLHGIDNPIFKDMEKKAKIAGEIEQAFSDLINQRQSLCETHESLQIKAHEHAPVNDVKQHLSSIDSSVRSISEAIPVINKHLQEYAAIEPSSDTPSLKQYEHLSPKELSPHELHEILLFTGISNATLVHMEQAVIDTANKFESALLRYDQYSAEIREQSEKNLDVLDAYLAFLTRPSISSKHISEIESTLSELQANLDGENGIMSELDRALSAWSAAKDGLRDMLPVEEGKEQKAKSCIVSGTTNESSADLKTRDDGDGRHQSSSPPDVDRAENLARQLEQAKEKLKSTSGIAHNPHLVYKWLQEHPDSKLDTGEVLDIVGIC